MICSCFTVFRMMVMAIPGGVRGLGCEGAQLGVAERCDQNATTLKSGQLNSIIGDNDESFHL
jgi:hypothetical protein